MSVGQGSPNAASLQLLNDFANELRRGDTLENVRAGVIGEGATIPGANGPVSLVYADYTASGRALRQVEHFIADHVLPFYSNSHTEASFCGAFMNRLRQAARAEIARICGVDDDYAVIFTGSGATAGINRLVHLLLSEAEPRGQRPLVLLGPYEHHSNILPWRESGAEVVELPEAACGGVDLGALEAALLGAAGQDRRVVASLSAASNVTGITSDVAQATLMIKRHGALAVWDFAGGGPYLEVDAKAGGGLDAIVLSPHKFVGGPAASGVLIVRKQAIATTKPSLPGGGTVAFVSPWSHRYLDDVVAREEAGTPNLIGDIRAALAFLVKEAIGVDFIRQRCQALRVRAVNAWRCNERIDLLGIEADNALPIFSFRIRDLASGFVHHQLVTRMLSDQFGIQARGGCACAGPYAHRLLGLTQKRSDALDQRLAEGDELQKPGWVRLNLSYLMDDKKADFIIEAVSELARDATVLALGYEVDVSTARFRRSATARLGT